jgi:hypothetical protein
MGYVSQPPHPFATANGTGTFLMIDIKPGKRSKFSRL